MNEIIDWYNALAAPFKLTLWIGLAFIGLAVLKKLAKLAILLTILIILIFVARAVIVNVS